jgi:exodeoxyribonuclease-5
MDAPTFYALLATHFPHQLKSGQDQALKKLSVFLLEGEPRSVFVLRGFAGTGKTTMVGTLVKQLWKIRLSSVLLAPTGRAAKVISAYSDKQAFTIHRKIYRPKSIKGGGISFKLQQNKHRNVLFIADEASMIPDVDRNDSLYEHGSLLHDLIHYVYSGHNCRLMLIGDTAQLPPVGLELSPALDPSLLQRRFDLLPHGMELDQVVRQASGGGILSNATRIREQLDGYVFDSFRFTLGESHEVVRPMDGHDLLGAIEESYARHGREETAFIVRSNKRANQYNQHIRQRILGLEDELAAGDYLMVVKNNYFWLDDSASAGFIANGDIIEVLEIYAYKELYGFRFAETRVRMVDYPDMKPFDTVLLLDTLTADSPSLPYEESNRLYQEVKKDYAHEKSNYKRFLAIKQNRYINALQVKFAYAMTCHKSQGGQWHTVFVEQPFLPEGINKEYLRWMYTAVTRAQKQLYLIGLPSEMVEQ